MVLIFFASLLVALVERQTSRVPYSAIFCGVGPLTYISEYPLAAAPRADCQGDEAREPAAIKRPDVRCCGPGAVQVMKGSQILGVTRR